MTNIIYFNENDFINNIMNEYDGRNYIIDYFDYCTSLFNKHFDILINNIDNIHNINNIILNYYTQKQIDNSKKIYNNNDYIKKLLEPKLFSKFLDAIDEETLLYFSDAETEIYYSDEEINYYDDNFDD